MSGEFLDILRIIVIERDANDLQPVLVAVGEVNQDRYFGAARRAPRSPKVDEDDFSFPRSGGDRITVEIGYQEGRHGLRIAGEADDALFTGRVVRIIT